MSSSSETSLVEEWETASSGSGSLSPSIGAKIEAEVAPSGEKVMSGDGATSVDQTDEGNGHQMASRQPSDGTLKRRMGSSRFRDLPEADFHQPGRLGLTQRRSEGRGGRGVRANNT